MLPGNRQGIKAMLGMGVGSSIHVGYCTRLCYGERIVSYLPYGGIRGYPHPNARYRAPAWKSKLL